MTMSGMKPKKSRGDGAMENDDAYWEARKPRAEITVTVAGPVGVGKSAVAYRIREALGGLQIGITSPTDIDMHRADAVTADVRIVELVTYPATGRSLFAARYKRYAAWPVVLWCRLRGHFGQASWGQTNRCLRCGDAR